MGGWKPKKKLPARERRTAQRVYEALCLEGYSGTADRRVPSSPGAIAMEFRT